LRMSWKHIFFPCLGIFQPFFSSVSKFSPPTYLSPPHLLPPSPHFLLTPLPTLGKAPKLEWLRA
jgi:hypothetical protein